MRIQQTWLLNLAIVLSLAFSGTLSGILTHMPVVAATSSAPFAAPGEVSPEPAARNVKRERKHDRKKKDRKQDRKKHDRKQKGKKLDRKKDRKKSRNQSQDRAGGQSFELTTGILPGADTVDPDPGKRPNSAEGRYIIALESGSGDALSVASDIAATTVGVTPTHVYHYVFAGFAAVIPDDKVNEVRNDPRVKSLVPDRVVQAYAQTLPTGVRRIDADENPTANIDGSDERVDVDVAIVDTAGNDSHEDLDIHAWGNCTPSHFNGDDDGHGTHVGGTVGALDNGIGVVGVAPGARLWNIRVLVNGSGFDSWIICGMDLVTQYATDQDDGLGDIEVVNVSLGGGGSDSDCQTDLTDLFHQAFCRTVAAGVTVVVAAGNSADDAANHTPAAYDEVITVSALADSDGLPDGLGPDPRVGEPDDSLALFSNFGADIDIAAPGRDILSTVPGGYDSFSGTSMASPHVAGAAALYFATHPGASPAQVKAALLSSREMIALPNDPDGINEGVLNVGPGLGASSTTEESAPSSTAASPPSPAIDSDQPRASSTDTKKKDKRQAKGDNKKGNGKSKKNKR